MAKASKLLREKWHILVLILLVAVVSYPALFMEMAKGHDLDFHLMRIEGIRGDVSFSNFPVRMQSPWIDGYGYPVSILYGDLFLYLGAFFRLLRIPIMPAYRLFVLCINSATVAIAYNSFRIILKKKEAAVFAAALYATAAYRLVDEYVRSAVGETLTIVFLPAILACISVIYTSDENRTRWKASVILAFVFTSVTCAHTLTTSMLLVVLAPGVIISLFMFCKKGERLKRFGNIFGAGIITIFLAAFFIVPFLDFYLNADIGFALDKGENIQGEGLILRDFFNFFCNPFKTFKDDIQKTPGIALMTVLVCAAVYLLICLGRRIRRRSEDHLTGLFKNHRRIVFEFWFSLALLFMTSRLFPWDFIEYNVPFGGLFIAIEFPMRYLAFAIVFLALLGGDMLLGLSEMMSEKETSGCDSDNGRRIFNGVCAVFAVMCVFNVVNLCFYTTGFEKKANFMSVEDLGRWDYYAMDFQLKNTSVDDLDLGVKYEGLLSFEVVSRDSNDWMIACVTGPDYGWVQFPVFAYPYYQAEDASDPTMKFEIHEGGNRTVGVLLPANYTGILHMYWREPLFWRVCEVISLMTFAACVIFLVRGGLRGIR